MKKKTNRNIFIFGHYCIIYEINNKKVISYLKILERFINKNEMEIYEKDIDILRLVDAYIEYMYTYMKYDNSIDYEEFLLEFLKRNLKTDYKYLHRQI